MNQLDTLFQLLVSVAVVSSVVLLSGILILHKLGQPIERIRCIQFTFAAWVAAMIFQQTGLLPSVSLPLLPPVPLAGSLVSDLELTEPLTLPSSLGDHVSSWPEDVIEPIAAASTPTASFDSRLTETANTTAAKQPLRWSAWEIMQAACVGVAGIGAVAQLAILTVGIWRLVIILRNCEPADPAILAAWPHAAAASRKGVRVLISELVSVPIAVGILRPVIVLPRQIATSYETTAIAFCLSHEWAHIKSRDVATCWLLLCLQMILWFQPLLWLLQRELRTAQDQLADSFATRGSLGTTDYASVLLRLARNRQSTVTSLALTMIGRRSSLYRRVNLLVSDQMSVAHKPRRRAVLGTLLGLTLLVLGISSVRLENASAAPPALGDATATGSEPTISIDDVEITTPKIQSTKLSGRVVDVAGRPAVNATVRTDHLLPSGWQSQSTTTDASGTFITAIPVKEISNQRLRIQAQDNSGKELGYFRFPPSTDQWADEPVVIQLESIKQATIKIHDGAGVPVVGGNVLVQLAYPHLLSDMKSDKNGTFNIRLPESERILGVVGWKDHVGLDYRIYQIPPDRQFDLNAKEPEFPSDGTETLVLDGAAPITVKVTDDQGKPLEGVRLYPWLLEKGSEPKNLNLTFFSHVFSQESDAYGQATFNWIPSWQEKPLQFWPSVDGFARIRGVYDVQSGAGVLELQLDRLVPIRGRVTGIDGKPGVGILVEAAGASRLPDRAKATTTTDAQGQYELLVPPEQIYIVVVKDASWASTPQDGFAVFKNQPVENKDFQLRKATRVFGSLTNAETQQPIPNGEVTFYQYGKELRSIQGVRLPNPNYSNMTVEPVHFYNAQTNEEGKYEIFLGDGNFDIRSPRQETAIKFKVAGEPDLQVDITTMPAKKQVELIGLVLAEDDSLPQGDVRIAGISMDGHASNWSAITGADGEFRVKSVEVPTIIYALSSDEKLATMEEVNPDERKIRLHLQPTVSATGRLVSRDSATPLGGKTLQALVKTPTHRNGMFRLAFTRTAVTDASGRFRVTGLLPGHKYSLQLKPAGITPFNNPILAGFTLTSEETLELGDVVGPVK